MMAREMKWSGFGGRIWLTIYWWFYSLFLPKDVKNEYKKLIKALDTPTKVMSWLFWNVKYTSDKTTWDEWQPAERTFERRKGDCEDWAIFACECLREHVVGYYLCMYTETEGHCEFVIEGDWWTSIGTYGLGEHHGTILEIIPDWSGFENWTMAVLMEEDMSVINVFTR